jgi:hypothetical protein
MPTALRASSSVCPGALNTWQAPLPLPTIQVKPSGHYPAHPHSGSAVRPDAYPKRCHTFLWLRLAPLAKLLGKMKENDTFIRYKEDRIYDCITTNQIRGLKSQ